MIEWRRDTMVHIEGIEHVYGFEYRDLICALYSTDPCQYLGTGYLLVHKI